MVSCVGNLNCDVIDMAKKYAQVGFIAPLAGRKRKEVVD